MAKKKQPESISDLLPDDQNANRHTERGMGLLEDQLKAVGVGRSILIDKNNKIIAGNGVVEAAGAAGIDRLRVVETSGNEIVAVKRVDLEIDSARGRLMAIGDNAIALRNIDLDADVLIEQAEEYGIDLSTVGLTDKELEAMRNVDEEPNEADESLPPEIDQKYLILIDCTNEQQQVEWLEKLQAEGLNVKAQVVQ